MENKIEYSILMAADRIDKYLFECLESLVKEINESGEIIIVANSGVNSNDIYNYIESEIELKILLKNTKIISSHSSGLSAALTLGLNYCSGEIVIRIDTDDIMKPERIRKQLDFLNSNSNVMVVGSLAELIDQNTKLLNRTVGNDVSPYYISKMMKIHCALIHPTCAFRIKQIRSVGGYGLHGFAEDYDLWTRVLRKYPESIAIIPEVLIKYRIHQNQSTATHGNLKKELYRKFIQVRELIYAPTITQFVSIFVPLSIGFRFIRLINYLNITITK